MAFTATLFAGALATTFLSASSYATGMKLPEGTVSLIVVGLAAAYCTLFNSYAARDIQPNMFQQNGNAGTQGADNSAASMAAQVLADFHSAVAGVPKDAYATMLARNPRAEISALKSFGQGSSIGGPVAHLREVGTWAKEGLETIHGKVSGFDYRQLSLNTMAQALTVVLLAVTAKIMARQAEIADPQHAPQLRQTSQVLKAITDNGGVHERSASLSNDQMAACANSFAVGSRSDIDRLNDLQLVSTRISGDGVPMSAGELCAIVKPFFKSTGDSLDDLLGAARAQIALHLSPSQWIDLSYEMASLGRSDDRRDIHANMLTELSAAIKEGFTETQQMAALSPWISGLDKFDQATQYEVINMLCNTITDTNLSDSFVDELLNRVKVAKEPHQYNNFFAPVQLDARIATARQQRDTNLANAGAQ